MPPVGLMLFSVGEAGALLGGVDGVGAWSVLVPHATVSAPTRIRMAKLTGATGRRRDPDIMGLTRRVHASKCVLAAPAGERIRGRRRPRRHRRTAAPNPRRRLPGGVDQLRVPGPCRRQHGRDRQRDVGPDGKNSGVSLSPRVRMFAASLAKRVQQAYFRRRLATVNRRGVRLRGRIRTGICDP